MHQDIKIFKKLQIESMPRFDVQTYEDGTQKITLTLEIRKFTPRRDVYNEDDFILYINNEPS